MFVQKEWDEGHGIMYQYGCILIDEADLHFDSLSENTLDFDNIAEESTPIDDFLYYILILVIKKQTIAR